MQKILMFKEAMYKCVLLSIFVYQQTCKQKKVLALRGNVVV
ncbi:hypothetical protein CM49_06544 [Paenibacillus sp. P1XP2]|nr:hypothetical protein CM49_06544 [Paenibacillus sp. P1XP2]